MKAKDFARLLRDDLPNAGEFDDGTGQEDIWIKSVEDADIQLDDLAQLIVTLSDDSVLSIVIAKKGGSSS